VKGLIFSEPQGRSFATATIYWVIALALAFAAGRFPLPEVTPPSEGHGALSIDLAANAVFCGTHGRQSLQSGVSRLLNAGPDQIGVPLREVLVREFGSIEKYCETLQVPYIHNENSLMLTVRALLRVNPDASADWIGRGLATFRLLTVLLCALVLLWTGASVVLTTAFVIVAVAVLERLSMTLSLYPFLAVLPLTAATFYGAAAHVLGPRWPAAGVLLAAGVGGWITGWGSNMRSSYLPIFLAVFAVFLAAAWQRTRGRWPMLGGAIVAWGAGFVVFNTIYITPLVPPPSETTQNYPYHSVSHSLVIGVATPENDFARGLGIAWDDQVGWKLAREVDPDVPYLGPGYERALFTYYWRLWQQYPLEMLRLYLFKMWWTGRDILIAIDGVKLPTRLREDRVRRLNPYLTGYVLYAVCLTIFALIVWRYLETRATLYLIGGCATLAALLVLVESTIIMPAFVGMYHGYLLLFFILSPVIALQAVLDSTSALRRTPASR
jgi:hypothetical protein